MLLSVTLFYSMIKWTFLSQLVTVKSSVVHPQVGGLHGICLSLLSTRPRYGTETRSTLYWISHVSTTLQVLVSIQGLVLTANPTLNDHDRRSGVALNIEINQARWYNKTVFLSSLREMTYMLRCPPKV
jgi:ubiquitin-conjugating enzyme E2 O